MEKKAVFYQEGNTVRKEIVTVPSREEEILALPAREEQQQPRRERKPAPQLNKARLAGVLLLTFVTVLFAYLGVTFLSLNASLTASRSNIYRLETRLAQLKADNLIAANKLEAQVDLAEVYQIATTELGMVHSDENEQLVYVAGLREYVRQYEDIPRK